MSKNALAITLALIFPATAIASPLKALIMAKLRTRFRNRTRMMKRRLIHPVKFLRGKKAGTKEKFRRAKEEILKIATAVWRQGQGVWEEIRGKAGGSLGSTLRVEGLESELRHWLDFLKKVSP